MDLIQENGQPRYGRFKELPTSIDVQRYIYKTPYGDVLKGWRKRLKFKKFKFCSIHSGQYSVGIGIVDVAWAGHCFLYIYDHQTQEVLEWTANNILLRQTVIDEHPLFNRSYFKKSPFLVEIQHANGVRYITVTKHGEIKLSARIFCAGTEPLSMCSPNGINGWTYTQKLTGLTCEGFFLNKAQKIIQFNDRTLASLDDTCGFLRPETAWYWLSCNFWDSEGRRIGINLSSGINESFGNENSLWINGVLYALTDVIFQQEDDHRWMISSLDGRLNLTVQTSWRRYENLNLRLVGSQFSQWQTRISGSVHLSNTDIIFVNEYGLFEQHYVKW